MKLQKYAGSSEEEAEHIKVNRLRAKLTAIRQKIAVKSGKADPGIQAMLITNQQKPAVGKYFGRPVVGETMAFDPKVFQQLPDLIRLMGVQNQVKNATDTSVFEGMSKRNITSGVFADAHKRLGITPITVAGLPIGVGGEGNKSASQQLRELDKDESQPVPVQSGPKGMVHTDPLRTHQEILNRIPPARQKQNMAVDPFEGMDPDLRKAMEAEDKRSKR